MSTNPDLCIVGAGALGIDLALYARRLGASVVLADREQVEPGDARTLAVRAAALSASAALVQGMRAGAEMGLGATEVKLTARQVAERVARVAAQQGRADAPEILSAAGVTVIRGLVSFLDSRSLLVGDLTIQPRAVVLALGGDPVIPAIAGLEAAEFFTPDTIFDNQRKLTHLVIIGGDAFAFEQAQVQRRLGAQVTLVPHGPALAGFDAECVAILSNILAQEGVVIARDAQIAAVNTRSQGIGVDLSHADGTLESLDASHLLVSMDRRVDFAPLDLGKTKIKTSSETGYPSLRGTLGATSLRHVRVVGAGAGQSRWAEAQAQGRAAIDSLLGQRRAVPLVPRIVETAPPLAEIGPLSGRKGKFKPGEQLLRQSFSENDRAVAMGAGHGLAKLSVDARGEILEGAILGLQAPELAAVLALAMDRRISLADLAFLPLPRPSLFTIITQLAETYSGSKNVSLWTSHARTLRRVVRNPFGG
ncbi:Pyruvate/2-oxoglutarate dehydrogenase complex, dihydrolipoamide dehydrogenase (E3) component [Devosia crocina]|uniref:Pyruvate/2-oxoglutarate dehydrogenase complex, dihydrolipoamide dehydrogenase (E3) component n=1 Tax=Devosia crocina TaxID=429728 RepID=A0A1I7N0Y8_9HYPH|nr:FAD-dependent oxidoreductase [Devosia crocina]SFV28298.1 Pyruvate/2-oxoglutarate dehydrogenase complex, dihydrolipoamide dehydrogenase (E3) component [Devosia crocina]